MKAILFERLQPLLVGLQTGLRQGGLQHLAALVPTYPVVTPEDFRLVQERIAVIERLLTLRPPSEQSVKCMGTPMNRLTRAVAGIERKLAPGAPDDRRHSPR